MKIYYNLEDRSFATLQNQQAQQPSGQTQTTDQSGGVWNTIKNTAQSGYDKANNFLTGGKDNPAQFNKIVTKHDDGSETWKYNGHTGGGLTGAFKARSDYNAARAKGGKLSFGSQVGRLGWTATGAIGAGKFGGSIAESRARQQAAKAGMDAQQTEKYVEQKRKQGKWAGRIIGGAGGFLGATKFRANTFKLKK